jgi:predicted secreted protein
MAPFTYFAIYFVVWWICLFLVLPFRVHNQVDAGTYIQGTERGAPVTMRFWSKVLWTSLLSVPVTAILLWLVGNPWLQEYWS